MENQLASPQMVALVNAAIQKTEIRDWIALGTLMFAVVAFIAKAIFDNRIARHRETIAFLEKRTKELAVDWKNLQAAAKNGTAFEEAAGSMFGMLDTVALLIRKGAFDGELIYNYWWKYFYAPLQDPQIHQWIDGLRKSDQTSLEHYCAMHAKWKKRIESELNGRPLPRPNLPPTEPPTQSHPPPAGGVGPVVVLLAGVALGWILARGTGDPPSN